ncbi:MULTISPECIES: hypothetical protein [Spirosoma]|uniref:UPF0323 domain-containing protein n=1 Tax=Spirosoma liriopis TaxID=2937440 RepID=A0ABT0HGR9_9BACT|nr:MULTISPECIES: hypothetical protein [Spirosoma]MCK8491351.1 hypothetical protein [Spirosoma liriopis]UHG90722.1 hypothetical protein LQ777_21065 [Spirosoma oryzicola]
MTPLRKHTVLKRVKDITLSATLSLALLNGSALLQSCGNNRSDENETEQTETSFRRGVRTYITETAPGNFKITDEEQADPDKAGAIVNYYDGHRDTLSVEAAKRLVESDQSTRTYLQNPGAYSAHHSNGLANALLWGGLGYMLGRSTAPQYRADERRYGSGFYTTPGQYERSQQIRENVRTSRVVRTTRPSGGRSGFFGGRSRGFSS